MLRGECFVAHHDSRSPGRARATSSAADSSAAISSAGAKGQIVSTVAPREGAREQGLACGGAGRRLVAEEQMGDLVADVAQLLRETGYLAVGNQIGRGRRDPQSAAPGWKGHCRYG